MSTYNFKLWQTVVFLFLSKFVTSDNEPFTKKQLINGKNTQLAEKFIQMMDEKTAAGKAKLSMDKTVSKLIQQQLLISIDDDTLQLSDAGFAMMEQERNNAMQKIAASFPETAKGQLH